MAVWKIEEPEDFFLAHVPLQRNITHPHKRLQHLAGRYLLVYLFPGFPHEQIEIADTRKPFLPDETYHFSISHCGDYAAAIVSTTRRVGIDVELLTPKIEKVMYKFLHADELAFVEKQAGDRLPLLTLLWSAKESLFKWWGRGEVDFREVMRLQPFHMNEAGLISGRFTKPGIVDAHMTLDYRLTNSLSLVWLHTAP
ncbi:4'-phosphopantetheinyl transferase family protein [Sediminibacterium ginsengisoli]|uniref:Enterobactin synthase component D n=1 Tax=Sediminibacterium ginsengisoli TaxID=413434 RepID=A0A1T4LJT1_9BACT|nr:4'-phosphopantetheinyl transferase superfamily protein [Sediminibacterium ginsengisoli]SJZ54694.1 Phosphopantetheinyl transferase [Sediminibacterium ginsengisoli]